MRILSHIIYILFGRGRWHVLLAIGVRVPCVYCGVTVCLIYMLILRTRVTQWASETSFRHSCMPNRTFILWVPCVKRNCRVCFQFLQGIGCGGATQIKSHTFAVSERHDKLRLSYRVPVTASGPSAARVAEQAVNHDIIVDNVSQKHINESRSLLTKFYFI